MKKIYLSLFALALTGAINAQAPTGAAPTPTVPSEDVISMFSDAYTNVAVDSWHTIWSAGGYEELTVEGNAIKKYSNLGFIGIETVGPNSIDASGMAYFNVDVWSPNFTTFKVKLVDFGADNAYQGGDDKEFELSYPGLSQNAWHTIKIPMSAFTGLTTQEHISQLIFASEGSATVFVDNIYFSNEEPVSPSVPATAAPDPEFAAENVMSLFSGVYTNLPVDSWNTEWSEADYEEVEIAGNATKKYSNLNFNGIEVVGPNALDVSDMTHFNLNVWSGDFTQLRIKLVDFGADNAHGGGDDSEHEITFNTPVQGQWITHHIPMTAFANLTGKEHLSQIIIASNGTSTVYVDNVFFNTEEVVISEPMTAAPDPESDEADVISLFSDAYTNQTVENWHTSWSTGTSTDLQIEGNDTKKLGGLGHVGVDIGVDNQIDISDMTFFNMNVWSSDFTTFTIKIVDFGDNGVWQGTPNDDSEGVYVVTEPTQGEWITLQIPLTEFTGLLDNEHISQFVFVSEGGASVFVDNIYFSKESSVGLNENNKAAFAMYPNPVKDVLTLQSDNTIEKITVSNMLGQQVLEISPATTTASVNVDHLQAGVYMVTTTANGAVSSKKFIKK